MQNGVRVQIIQDGVIKSDISLIQQADAARSLTASEAIAANMQLVAQYNGYENWKAQVHDPANPGQFIDNPMSFWDAAVYAIGTWGRSIALGAIRKQAQEQFNSSMAAAESSSNAAAETVNNLE